MVRPFGRTFAENRGFLLGARRRLARASEPSRTQRRWASGGRPGTRLRPLQWKARQGCESVTVTETRLALTGESLSVTKMGMGLTGESASVTETRLALTGHSVDVTDSVAGVTDAVIGAMGTVAALRGAVVGRSESAQV